MDTEHYRIYTTTKNPTVLDYLPGFRQAARANYHAITGLAPTSSARSMSVYMFATRQQWVVMTDRITANYPDPFTLTWSWAFAEGEPESTHEQWKGA